MQEDKAKWEGKADKSPAQRPGSLEGSAMDLHQQAGLQMANENCSSACPQGIGGYCLNSRIAWRYRLPEDLAGRATLTTLEFLATFMGMVVEFRKGKAWTLEEVLRSQGDSTSAAGWLAKLSFDVNCPLHLTIASAFADYCLTHEINHFTQWFPGRENKMAEMLSQDFMLDNNITLLIRKHGSPFVPQHFKVIPLRPTLMSQIGGRLQLLPKTQLLPPQPAPSTAAAGIATRDSLLGRIGVVLDPFLLQFGQTE